MPRFPSIVVGGTFDGLHAGHRRLLQEAFHHGRRVGIGLTTDSLVRASPGKGSGVAPYSRRLRQLRAWLTSHYPEDRWFVVPLSTPEGSTLEPKVRAIAVSEETAGVAHRTNLVRRRRGLPPMDLVIVGTLYGEDLLPIASRRIRAGLIDGEGRRRKPLTIGWQDPKTAALGGPLLSALSEAIPEVKIRPQSRDAEYRVSLVTSQRSLRLAMEDSLGGRLEATVRGGWSPFLPTGRPGRAQIEGVLPQLVFEALLPRWLSRERILPASFVLLGGHPPAPRAGEWNRKVYSGPGIFPLE
ncbi:MAG: pantetheine-phosphate adenylyltransferase [Candidatus Thermoplasmatota archaeon]|jgi:pantetheine-phosphate adenylyltransferase|nr:pantetheine-phosphate adenylyltransferase [Candidatus Thermoplasmatota archaeon]